MAELPFNFAGPSYVSQSPNWSDAAAINCFCERAEVEGQKGPIAIWDAPGKKLYCTLAEEIAVPSQFELNGRSFAAASNLWETTGGTPVNWGSIGTPPTRPTMITANATQLVVLNNGNLFVFTLATNTLTAVNMAQFNGPISQIGFSDGYIIATIQNSQTFQQSNLEDATTWSGLNISTISYFPDNIVSMVCDHREVWFYSGKQAVVFYNSGAGFPVFIPIQGAFLEVGSGATFSIVKMDNSIFWLSQDERGSMIAYRANGYSGERKSTHAQELAFQLYGVPFGSDAVGWTYQEYGHTFWVLYFPSANATWAYDVASGFWHQRAAWNVNTGTFQADRAMSHTFANGLHLVGDPFSGNIYQLSSTFFTDDTLPLRRLRRSFTNSIRNKRVYFDQIEFDVDAGVGPSVPLTDGDGQPRSPQIVLRWSDDGGNTWSNDYFLSVGLVGQYKIRTIKRMLGKARKRVWEVSWDDPVPIRFANAYLYGEPEQGLQ
jgi:hypothetical protein